MGLISSFKKQNVLFRENKTVMKTIRDKTNLSGAQILAISGNTPEQLFSGDLGTAQKEYHALCRCWHPDRNRDVRATAVFQRVTELYRKAQELIKAERWRGAGILKLPDRGSGAAGCAARHLKYQKRVDFELGEMYLAENEVAFAVERQYADLFENARRQIAKFRFADEPMRKEIARNLPLKPEYFTSAKHLFMVLPKTADTVLLEDLLEYLGCAIDARHVAWISNRLHNLACYFEYAGIVHHDISPRTFFISPKSHTGNLLGGWWYARSKGEKINALPKRTIELAPPDVIRSKQADGRTDLELIRQTGREMLGVGVPGSRIKTNEKIPPAMARWFNGATSGSAVTDYELWRNVLETDFGKPRFVRFEIHPEAIYGSGS